MLAKKSRRGRPRGRKAPHRPVLSTVLSGRVEPEFVQQVKTSAKAAGRTVAEEVIFQARQGYVWGAAHGTVAAMLGEARGTVERTKRVSLEQMLREHGYTRVRDTNGRSMWIEAGAEPLQLFNDDTRALLQEMFDRAAERAIQKLKGG